MISRAILAVMTSLLVIPAFAADPGPKLPDTFDVKAIDAYLSAQVQKSSRVGLTVAIVKNGEVVLAKGYGKRSLEDGRSVEPDTLFAIGSVSKQFTCACILLLAEEGKLSVYDKVAKYYPNLSRANDITLLDLMNHVSGYPDYYPLDFVDRRMKKPIAEDELLRQYAGGKLDFEPGSEYSYSNTGYILLGRVVEKVSGESFTSYLNRRILKPLEMTQTAYEPEAGDSRLAQGYTTFALSEPLKIDVEGKGWVAAAGGIYSTPSDLMKWNLALISGKVLKPESYALMTTPRKLSTGKSSTYGCGLGVRTENGRQIISHGGAVSGFNCSSLIVPSTRSAVVMSCNLDGGLGTLPTQILSLVLKEPTILPTIKGSPVVEIVKRVFKNLQDGKVNRSEFGEEFNIFLSDEKVAGASKRLKAYGTPSKVEVASTNERGGMEVTTTRLTFADGTLRVLMYRMPDGKIEQFFVSKD